MLTVKELLERSLTRYSSRVLMTYVDSLRNLREEITYAEFELASKKLANSFKDLGLRKGDKVAYLLLNRPETVIVNLASIRSGLVGVGINPILGKDDMEHIIKNSEAKVIVVDYWLQDLVRERMDKLGVEHVIAAPYGEAGKIHEEFTNLYDLIDEGSEEELNVDVNPDDVVFLVYTGGTTGVPKGAVHTHESMAMNMLAHVVEFDIRDGEKLLLVTPLVHAAGAIALASIVKGSNCVVTFRFDVEEILRLIQDEKVTWLWAVPTMIYRMLDSGKIGEYDLSSLRTIVYGAAPMSPSRLREAIEVFGHVFIQLYGQVEVPQLISVLTKDDHRKGLDENEEILKSAGRASLMAQIKVVDENGNELEKGEIGIIAAKTPYNMKEYWRNQEETAKVVKNGWILTGDVGYIDDEGYIFLVDREKDMIVSGGYNVYSTKVERVIAQHPAVSNVAVIGTPHPEWGEAVTAVIQLKPERKVRKEEIIEFCKERKKKYEVPKRIEFVEALPLTPIGKVNKRELRKIYWKGSERYIH